MKVFTRLKILVSLASLCMATVPAGALAASDSLSCHTVTMVLPFPPGSTTDTIARALGTGLSSELKKPVVIENRPGAEGLIAAEDVMRSAPDGCRILFATSGNLSVAPLLRSTQPYDPRKDFTPIAEVGIYTYVLYVRPEFPARTFSEFVTTAKSAPGRYTYGTGSNTNYLLFGYIDQLTGTDLRRISYKGEPPAITDMLGGRIDAIVATTMGVPYVREGKLRALAVMGHRRSPLLPDVPTFSEVGLKDFDIVPWAGVVGPAKMDPATAAALEHAINRALASPQLRSVAESSGFMLDPTTQERFKALVAQQHVVYGQKVKELHLPIE